jgi:outer membrane lipoprotein SlyB
MSRRALASSLLALAVVFVGVTPVLAQAGSMQKIRYGEIVAMSQVMVQVQGSRTGSTVGATAGAVAGYALADYGDRWLGGLLGGVLGGAAGNAVDKASRKKKGWELIILVDGEEIGIQVPGKKQKYKVGDRVRLMTDPSGRTSVTPVKD